MQSTTRERERDKMSARIYFTYAIYMKPSKSDSKVKKMYTESYNCSNKTKIAGKTNIASTVPLYFTNITTSFIPAILSEVVGSNMWLLSFFCQELKSKLSNVVEDSTCNKIKMKYNFL